MQLVGKGLLVKRYAIFSESGFPAGFYSDEIQGPRHLPVYGEANSEGVRQIVGYEDNPDCKTPVEAIEISEVQWLEFIDNPGVRCWQDGVVLVYEPPTEPVTIADYSQAIQSHLDTTARQRQYDGMQAAVSYRDDPNPLFAAEAEALFSWRSAVWTYSTTELKKVQAGERAAPTVADFIRELPAFVWPYTP